MAMVFALLLLDFGLGLSRLTRVWDYRELGFDPTNNAFLHGDLDEEVYMKIPQGFSTKDETRVCKLQRSIYGLKQASRNWYHKFTKSLIVLGYKQSKADHSLFIYKNGDTYVAALIYVDDVILVGNDEKWIERTKSHLDKEFSIKDLDPLKYFLGIEVAKTFEGLVLSQYKCTLDILQDSGLQGCRPSSFPMEPNLKVDKGEEKKIDASRYRRLVGRLLYLQVTRPDIAYSVSILSQFVGDPRSIHMEAANRVLRYLKTTIGQGILLPNTSVTDLDPVSRRSRSGYVLLLGGAPISWKSKKQSIVSRSSAEAEYRSMTTAVSEITWVRWLLKELDVAVVGPTPLFCDNQAAKHIANNPVFHERTKHVEMDCYFVRERVERKEIMPVHINSKQQIADLLTKPLGSHLLQTLLIISVSLLDGLMILLRNATRITHKALGVTCLVYSFDAPDLETDTPPTSAMGNQVFHHDALSDNEDVGSEDVLDNTKLIPVYASSTIPFHKRQALGLHNHSDDRDVIGVMVLWLLGKTVGIS
ncbi:putative RNA-directed DNA polymerase [Tanacetum coccineum]|uniref:RNA-directed DNA polymerase n=1 Tax=Tanacetum coccineum TaxID=301880 RepID=A0ABQ5J4Q4_9ASTR